MVDSCLECKWCKEGEENYCDNGMTGTYNGVRKHGRVGGNQDLRTYGGYTGSQVTHEHFIIKINPDMDVIKKNYQRNLNQNYIYIFINRNINLQKL